MVRANKILEEMNVSGRELEHSGLVCLFRHPWHQLPHQVTGILNPCTAQHKYNRNYLQKCFNLLV